MRVELFNNGLKGLFLTLLSSKLLSIFKYTLFKNILLSRLKYKTSLRFNIKTSNIFSSSFKGLVRSTRSYILYLLIYSI